MILAMRMEYPRSRLFLMSPVVEGSSASDCAKLRPRIQNVTWPSLLGAVAVMRAGVGAFLLNAKGFSVADEGGQEEEGVERFAKSSEFPSAFQRTIGSGSTRLDSVSVSALNGDPKRRCLIIFAQFAPFLRL